MDVSTIRLRLGPLFARYGNLLRGTSFIRDRPIRRWTRPRTYRKRPAEGTFEACGIRTALQMKRKHDVMVDGHNAASSVAAQRSFTNPPSPHNLQGQDLATE